MNYTEWLKTLPGALTEDSLWKVEGYRLALFAAEFAWRDITRLMQDKRNLQLAGQLYDAIGSIGVNISEGYSRGSGRDRARFYECALGSARESRTWYFDARHVLGESVMQHRLDYLTHIIRLLLTMVPDQRGHSLHEEGPSYNAKHTDTALTIPSSLTTNIPLP